jgi:hypothetical protein
MAEAICIACGGRKRLPWQICNDCGLDPTKDEMLLVKSVYLSTGRYDDDSKRQEYAGELEVLGSRISKGQPIEFDDEELARLLAQKRLVESVPMRAVWGAIFRTFFPGIIFLLILFAIVFVLRSLQ